MAMKRKLDLDSSEDFPQTVKQLKLVPLVLHYPQSPLPEKVPSLSSSAMAMKRKLDLDSSEDFPQTVKQLKLVPFPGYVPDHDVAMSDSPSSDSEPFFPENHHTRLVSTASTSSDLSEAVDYNSPLYPRYSAHQPALDPPESPKVVGLMQPASTLSHHGSQCSQIPKLRVACSAGLDGSRTMWSFCEQCGAISMVDTD